jgi:hypothetical protein
VPASGEGGRESNEDREGGEAGFFLPDVLGGESREGRKGPEKRHRDKFGP